MAILEKYKCESCSYEVISAGVESTLLAGKTNVFMCHDCELVFDMLTQDWDGNKLDCKCPVCKGHGLSVWDGRLCPKCFGRMGIIKGHRVFSD